jgi:hypothetical protein
VRSSCGVDDRLKARLCACEKMIVKSVDQERQQAKVKTLNGISQQEKNRERMFVEWVRESWGCKADGNGWGEICIGEGLRKRWKSGRERERNISSTKVRWISHCPALSFEVSQNFRFATSEFCSSAGSSVWLCIRVLDTFLQLSRAKGTLQII